jgi:ribosomal protein S18 acetylase RimI-like enzyme
MSESEFQAYLEVGIPTYAQESVRAGRWHEAEALQEAQKEFQTLLPEGLTSQDNYLFSIVHEESGVNVGMIWFGVTLRGPERFATIWELLIFAPFRHRGYGRQTMQLIEQKVQELGINELRLHVFGHNHVARALYEQLGYMPTNLRMVKRLI